MLQGSEGVLNPKGHPIRSINQRIHHVLHGGIIDGVVYFRKWWSVTILSLGKSVVNLTVWSADKSLSSGVSTVCSQDADLCHFFLTIFLSLSWSFIILTVLRCKISAEICSVKKRSYCMKTNRSSQQKMTFDSKRTPKKRSSLFLSFLLNIWATWSLIQLTV